MGLRLVGKGNLPRGELEARYIGAYAIECTACQSGIASSSKLKRAGTVRKVKFPLSSEADCAAVRMYAINILCALTEIFLGEVIFQ